jgi:hypothetical protein
MPAGVEQKLVGTRVVGMLGKASGFKPLIQLFM